MLLGDSALIEPRSLEALPGLGVGTMLHCFPSQCSISDLKGPARGPYPPVTQILLAESTEIPSRALSNPPGLGFVVMLQFVPFQCSISVFSGSSNPFLAF